MKIRYPLLLAFLFAFSCEPDNVAPNAHFDSSPPQGTVKTLFDFDATDSEDPDGLKSLLVFRWDVNGDGEWDTPFGSYRTYSWKFEIPGTYTVKLEVKDTYDAISSFEYNLLVDSLHHMTDPRDGQIYPIVKLGTYWWMARNLNYGVPLDPSVWPTDSFTVEKYIYPADDPDNLNGGLYTWYELMGPSYSAGSRGICPPGWFVPSDAHWRNMMSLFRAAVIRTSIPYHIWGEKWVPDQTVTHDNYGTEGALWRLLRETGSTGFDAVMLGYRDPDGNFGDRDYHFPGKTATFWTSTMAGDRSIRVRLYQTDDHVGDVFRLADNRMFAFSVRCIKESL
jgi:uncharacterized protein (TIGR02145 family)